MLKETAGPEETREFARSLGNRAKGGEVYALRGDLGAGKTVLAAGFAEGLGIKERVNSPTYTILHSYSGGRLTFHHFDVYRIEEPEEMEETGMDDCFTDDAVCFIEWAERIADILPPGTKWIRIDRDPAKGDDYRRIEIEDTGN